MVRRGLLMCATAAMMLSGCHKAENTPKGVSAAQPTAAEPVIQTKSVVVEASDNASSVVVGIMAGYNPSSRSFWWRATPMIAEPSMLDAYYEAHCKFFLMGTQVANMCVRGPDLLTSTTYEHADSLDAGLEKVQKVVKEGGAVEYKGPHDALVDLKAQGQDLTTPEGTPPASITSIKPDGIGYQVEVACACGDRTIFLNRDFMSYKIVKK